MDKKEYRKNAEIMIYLVSCALNDSVPDGEKLKNTDLSQVFEVCKQHNLTACAAYALESLGISDHSFTQAKEKAVRKNILLDIERERILDRLEAEKIWYMPLKGAILGKWYPKLGMRQMSDNDILFDSTKADELHDILCSEGYACKNFGHGNHDIYHKKPVLNFEMHRSLFSPLLSIKNIYKYYENVKSRLILNEGTSFGYHFKNEDLYLYVVAHEYKHFSKFGTGIRSLADIYVFLRKKGDSLDWEYIYAELQKLGIAEFEKKNCKLAFSLFEQKELSAEKKELLDYYVFSGTYGKSENFYDKEFERYGNSKLSYFRHRFFPSYKYLRESVPWVKKSRLLIPAAYLYRFLRSLFLNKSRVTGEISYIARKKRTPRKQAERHIRH